MARRRSQTAQPARSQWPLLVGMVSAAFVIAAAVAAWRAVGVDAPASLSDRLTTFATSLLWPGAAIFVGALVVMWAGWKFDLD